MYLNSFYHDIFTINVYMCDHLLIDLRSRQVVINKQFLRLKNTCRFYTFDLNLINEKKIFLRSLTGMREIW